MRFVFALAWVIVGVGLGLGGCLSDLPHHCANNEGDATCVPYGAKYCDSCRLENGGCTNKKPTIICEYPGEVAFAGAYSGDFAVGCGGPEPELEEFVFEVASDGAITGQSVSSDKEMTGDVDQAGNVEGVIHLSDDCRFEGMIGQEGEASGQWSCSGGCSGEWAGVRE